MEDFFLYVAVIVFGSQQEVLDLPLFSRIDDFAVVHGGNLLVEIGLFGDLV